MYRKIFIILILTFLSFSIAGNILAGCTCTDIPTSYTEEKCIEYAEFYCVWTDESSSTSFSNPLGDGVTPNMLIGKIISAALGIVGSLALLMFIYGGFTWMLASGNAEAVSKGKNILIWATIGLVVIFSSYALVVFVFKSLGLTIT